jgi:hypothetical protein
VDTVHKETAERINAELTINEAVSAGLPIARELLGSVNRYCLYVGFNDAVIEFRKDDEDAVKLIYSENPTEALTHFYNAEKRRLVRCESVR